MPVGRVTYRLMTTQSMQGVTGAMQRVQELQSQLASSRRVTRAGDDPGAASASLLMRSQKRANEQFVRNINDATGRLDATDGALQAISNQLRSARNLLLSAANGPADASQRASIAANLSGILEEVIDQYNTQWLGRPVFGGTVAGEVAIDKATGAYVGNDAPVEARISREALMRIDTPGSVAGADSVPDVLRQAIDQVINNPGGLSTDIEAMDGALDTVLSALGDVGARGARLETSRQHVEFEIQDFSSRISEYEDADLAETMMKLQAQQVAYQAAIGSASKVMQTSLMDFLR